MSTPKTLASRYALEGKIAASSHTTVYKARDEVLARAVAVKVLNQAFSEDEGFLARFKAAAIDAARLTHPHIAAIYDTGEEDTDGSVRHYTIVEYCGSGSLADIGGTGQSIDRAVSVAIDVCDALAYSHGEGVVHGDLRPSNVLVTTDGTTKVADFAVGQALAALPVSGTTNATTFIAPETRGGRAADARSDVYSVGALAYFMLTGKPPPETGSSVPPHPRALRADIPRNLDTAVARALAPEPGERWQGVDELGRELRIVRGHTPTRRPAATQRVPIAPRAPRAPRSSSDMRWLAPVLILLAVAILAALLLPNVLRDRESPTDRSGTESSGPGAAVIEVAAPIEDFDPHGDGEEHSERVGLAGDGNPSTAWTTESYNDPLSLIKPGVGLVFDLGDSQAVATVAVVGCGGCDIEIRAGDSAPASESDLDVVDAGEDVAETQTFDVQGEQARYWLVWITSLPGDGGGQAAIGEVRFSGS